MIPNKQLGTPVPTGCHVICQLLVDGSDWASKTEIAQLQLKLMPYEQILRFKISMYDVFAVHEAETLDDLVS